LNEKSVKKSKSCWNWMKITWRSVWVSWLPATLNCNKSALLNENLIRLLGQSRR
jgi:hypothetical protein